MELCSREVKLIRARVVDRNSTTREVKRRGEIYLRSIILQYSSAIFLINKTKFSLLLNILGKILPKQPR